MEGATLGPITLPFWGSLLYESFESEFEPSAPETSPTEVDDSVPASA